METPTLLYRARLREALAASKRDDPGQARRQLANALQAVNNQPAFVFDAFDCLVQERALELAQQLTTFEAWPEQSPIAKAKASHLSDAAAGKLEAPAATEAKLGNSDVASTPQTEGDRPDAAIDPSEAAPKQEPAKEDALVSALGKADAAGEPEVAGKPDAGTKPDGIVITSRGSDQTRAAGDLAVSKLEDMREVGTQSAKAKPTPARNAMKPGPSKATRAVARSKAKAKHLSKKAATPAKTAARRRALP